MNGRACGQRGRGDRAEVFVDELDRRRSVYIADDDVDGVVWMVPSVVQCAKLGCVDLGVEGLQRAEAIIAIWRAGEHRKVNLDEEMANRIAIVLRDLVLYCASLDLPIGLRQRKLLRARGF